MDNHDLQYYLDRKRASETMAVIGYCLLGLCFILWLPSGASGQFEAIILCFLGFLSGGIIASNAKKKLKRLSIEFKTKYLTQEFAKIYPDCVYDPNRGFSQEEIYGAKILKKQDRYHSEDYMAGIYDGVEFTAADVKLEDVRKSGKSTQIVTVFLGRVYKFRFNKNFQSNVLINQPSLFDNLFGWSRIKTESVEFNRELTVYSDNQHEAFYLLTPHFMEKLLELDKKYKDRISFSFINNLLYIAIDTREDTFDLKMFHPFDQSIIENYRKQLTDIKEFIHHLNLNQNLFKPEEK